MKGEGDVVTGWKNKLQTTLANVTPSDMLAERHRKIAEPGSGKPQTEGRTFKKTPSPHAGIGVVSAASPPAVPTPPEATFWAAWRIRRCPCPIAGSSLAQAGGSRGLEFWILWYDIGGPWGWTSETMEGSVSHFPGPIQLKSRAVIAQVFVS